MKTSSHSLSPMLSAMRKSAPHRILGWMLSALIVWALGSACGPRDTAPTSGHAEPTASAEAASADKSQTEAARVEAARAESGSPGPAVAAAALPACVWCGASEAPATLTWDIRIAPASAPGQPLVLSGSVRYADGRPASDIVLYLYHTDHTGHYTARADERGNGPRHGALRAWLRPDAEGRYRITTIRPAPYPNRTEPAHIHATVLAPDTPEYWLDSFVFADDPLLPAHLQRAQDIGGSGVVELVRGADGIWRGQRDIVLPASPPSTDASAE